jgi:diaminopimelate epimerase
MRLRFTKMHGAGNDFVMLDGVRQRFDLSTDQLRRLADRHFGVGADQILVVEPARHQHRAQSAWHAGCPSTP